MSDHFCGPVCSCGHAEYAHSFEHGCEADQFRACQSVRLHWIRRSGGVMSGWWLVLDDASVVQMKTRNEMEARTYALVKGWEAMPFPDGATVSVVVCSTCKSTLRNGACPEGCHDRGPGVAS